MNREVAYRKGSHHVVLWQFDVLGKIGEGVWVMQVCSCCVLEIKKGYTSYFRNPEWNTSGESLLSPVLRAKSSMFITLATTCWIFQNLMISTNFILLYKFYVNGNEVMKGIGLTKMIIINSSSSENSENIKIKKKYFSLEQLTF